MSGSDDFDEFYRFTVNRLVRYAYGLTGDPVEAQDLTHEAYARAWEHWRKVRGYDQPEAWLRVVVTRLAADRWRRWQVRKKHMPILRPPDSSPAPGDDTMYVTALLRQLPLEQRRALVLHYLFDMSVEQIAAEMSANPNTVKSWLSRGRAALSAHVTKQEVNHV